LWNIGPNSPGSKVPPLPASTTHLLISQRSITLLGLGSQLTALPLDEELELASELELELASDELDDELTTTSELDEELTTTSELDEELTTSELDDELTATELDEELTATELDELTATELAFELTATELELLLDFLLLLPPQAVIRTLNVSTTANCFTITIVSPT